MRRMGGAIIVLVVLLLTNVTYIQVVQAKSLRANENNTRTVLEEYSRQRGQITAHGGVVLARSVPSGDSYRYQREYPLGAEYSPITGYYSLLYGAKNIEKNENAILSGEDDSLLGPQIGDILTGRDPRGGNVQLSVIPSVQDAAYHGLTDRGYVGAVVALRPSTGEILALATTPTYDPSPLASHSDQVQKQQSDIINSSTPPQNKDRATDYTYPPGSTFKLVVAGAALQDGYSPQSDVTGVATLNLPDGGTLSNFGLENCADGDGSRVSLIDALAHSCNTAFAEVGMEIGADAIKKQAAALGIDDQSYNVGVDVAGSRTGPMVDQDAVAQSSIGQRDVSITPMQNAVIAATVANRGVRMNPYLVEGTTAPDLSPISTAKPTVADANAMPAAVADQIRDMMIASEEDTDGSGSIAGVQIASKTGTAEHGDDPKNTPPHVWYVAFAPAQNPTVAVAVLVENGGNGDLNATGGKVAAPIGRAVIAAALSAG